MKGTPAKIILVHGTWGRGFDPDKDAQSNDGGKPADPRWFEAGSKFRVALSSGLSGLVRATDFSAFLWSGANSIEERRRAAARLAKTLDESVAAAPEAPHFVIAHSHGGNVALEARQLMSGNAFNVDILTLATPFLSIYQRTPRISDKLFAICLSIGAVVFASYLLLSWVFGLSGEYAVVVLVSANCFISLFSVLFGVATFFSGAYQAIRKKQPIGGPRSRALNWAKRINNQSLLASGLLFCAAWLAFGLYIAMPVLLYVAMALLIALLPAILLLFLSISSIGDFLYGTRHARASIRRTIPNLMILRSQRDEASLALFFGKIASLLAHIAGSISIIVPIVAASLAVVFVYFSLSEFRSYQECVARGHDCLVFNAYVLLLLDTALKSLNKIGRYLAVGFCVCVIFVLLAAVCKSLFGRELLYRSRNVIVDVYDTPDGSNSYNVDWCARLKGSAFGLRHSLYNNPDAVQKIIARIHHVRAAGTNREMLAAAAQHYEGPRNGIWRAATAFAVVAGTYAIVVLVAYAPPGATSAWCALNAYFEPSGLKGGFTILVARFENDDEGVGDRLAKEVDHRYGLHVIRTCLQVTTNSEDQSSAETSSEDWSSAETSSEDRSSAETLLSSYNSNLVLWGKVAKGGHVELQVRLLRRSPDASMPIMLTQAAIAEFVAKQLRRYLLHAIEDSAKEVSSSEPPANLADYADRVDALVQNADWSDESLEGVMGEFEKFELLRDRIRINAAAGKLMLDAALASHDSGRVKKAIDYFVRASSIYDSSGKFKDMILDDWSDVYRFALLSDGRLNKAEASAKLAASMYLKEYEKALKNSGVANDDLQRYAGVAASAASELYSITHSQDAANSAIRLACESLLHLRYSEDAREHRRAPGWLAQQQASGQEELEKRDRSPAQEGPEAPPPEQSEAYKILERLGKDPSPIFAPGPKMKDCVTF